MSSTAVAHFVCPWACVASAPPKLSVAPPVISNRSFAQALLNKVDVSLTELPKPCMKDPLILEPIEHVPIVDLSDISHVQNSPACCGMSSSTVIDEVLNPNVAHDLAILKQYWEGKDASDIGHRVYTDEEEREAAINFLKNRDATREEPFTEVVSKAKKKKLQKGFQVHNTRSRGRHPD
ncbi:hypothetical protein P8452_16255 [Trifolium repens]|nr:hypothetical protein P8452_16255 [Trifolium repens]